MLRLRLPLAERVRFVPDRRAVVAVHAHLAVAVGRVGRGAVLRPVHRDLVVVDPEPVPLRVAVGEEPALEHLVGREPDPGHYRRRVERGLLDVLEVVLGVPVQFEHANLDERELGLVPDLGEIERVVRHLPGLLLGHHLDVHRPAGEVAALDRVVQVALVALAVLRYDHLGLLVREVLDPLLGVEMELDPDSLVGGIDHREGMAPEPVHVAVRAGDAAVAHGDRHLVERLGERCPEVPVVRRAPQVRPRVPFDRAVQVREVVGVAQEEDRGVVADKIPVSLLGVELHREAPDVPLGVGCATLAGHGREPGEGVGLLSDLREDLRPGEPGDVVRDGESPEGSRSLGVHAPLGDHLAVEMRELLLEPDVLHQDRAAWAGRYRILVIDHGGAGGRRQSLLLVHLQPRQSSPRAPVLGETMTISRRGGI